MPVNPLTSQGLRGLLGPGGGGAYTGDLGPGFRNIFRPLWQSSPQGAFQRGFIDDQGTSYASRGAANRAYYDRFGLSAGHQGAAMELADLGEARRINETLNQRKDELWGGLQQWQQGLGDARSSRVQGILDTGDEEANRLRELGDTQYRDFTSYRDRSLGEIRGLVEEQTDWAKRAFQSFDENSLASVSAAAGGVARSVNTQVKELQNQLANTFSPGQSAQIQQAIAQAKFSGMQQLQSVVSPMIDERNRFKAQLGMGVSQAFGQGASTIAGATTAFGQQTLGAQGLRQQAYENSASLRRMAQLDAAAADARYAQLELGGFGMMAEMLRTLPPTFVNQFDSFLKMMFSVREFGDRTALNMRRLGGLL